MAVMLAFLFVFKVFERMKNAKKYADLRILFLRDLLNNGVKSINGWFGSVLRVDVYTKGTAKTATPSSMPLDLRLSS